MKNFLSLVVFTFLISTSLLAQTFTFTRTSPPIVYVTFADSDAVSYAEINNLTGGNIWIKLYRLNVSVPSGWETAICDIVACYPPFVDSTDSASYSPGVSTGISAYFYHHQIPGTGYFTIRAKRVGSSEFHEQTFGGQANPIGIKQISSVIKEFSLSQNYPNPFNPSTKINFSVPAGDYVDLRVYDILGREVKVLLSQYMTPGEYEVDFDAHNLASGMYYYRLKSKDNVAVKKMTLVK